MGHAAAVVERDGSDSNAGGGKVLLMTRRIALAILLSVWAVLLIGAVAAYFAVRSVLIADVDSLLYARAVSLPELAHTQPLDPKHTPQYDWTDTYTIKPATGILASRAGRA
jgi:hypothetical protein